MPPGKWTQEELDFLVKSYASLDWSIKQIADYLERSEHSVVKKASFLGIKKLTCSKVVPPEGYKVCRTCKQFKLHDEFYKNNSADRKGDGLDSSCKACVSQREKTRRQEKKMKELEMKVALEDKIPKEEFIRANQGILFKCTNCGEKKVVEAYTIYWKQNKVCRAGKCKKCANEITKEQELVRLRKKGYL